MDMVLMFNTNIGMEKMRLLVGKGGFYQEENRGGNGL